MKYFLLVCILLVCNIQAQPEIAASLYTYRGEIEQVEDGDTITVSISLGFGIWKKGLSIRLLEVFAPETRTKDLEEKKNGLLVKDFLIKEIARLSPGNKIIVKTQKDKDDKYGRIVGQIWIGGEELNALIRNFMTAQGIKPGGKGT